MKTTKKIMIILACAVALAGCRERQKLTLKQEVFLINAQNTLEQCLSENTGEKVRVDKIIILDSAWTEATVYNDNNLSEMKKKLDAMTSMDAAFSDDDFLESLEKIEDIKKEMQEYKENNRKFWGYKITVEYRVKKQIDTVNCEIDFFGTNMRGLSAGGDIPLESIKMLDNLQKNEYRNIEIQ